jgi:NDP-sugar pyrophosphorylase family protein
MIRQALILAGGAGTRLRPLVSDLPKPLAPVAGRPFIDYLLLQLRANGINRAVVCAGYRADALMAHLGDGSAWGIELEFSVEDQPLGTGGALRLAAQHLAGDRCLVMNGDSLFDIPLPEFDAEHVRSGATFSIALATEGEASRYGSVAIDSGGWVTDFEEKSNREEPTLINAGLYMIERKELEQIPAARPVSLEREIMPALIGSGLRGQAFEGYFVDIGVPDDYLRAQSDHEVWERLTRL